MVFELPIEHERYVRIKNFNQGAGMHHHVLFRLANGMHADTLFILVHGAPDGTMHFGKDNYLTSEQVLRMLIDTARIKDKGVTRVHSISCHGGIQPTVVLDGVTFSSMHEYHGEIAVSIQATMDDEYFIYVDVPQ